MLTTNFLFANIGAETAGSEANFAKLSNKLCQHSADLAKLAKFALRRGGAGLARRPRGPAHPPLRRRRAAALRAADAVRQSKGSEAQCQH